MTPSCLRNVLRYSGTILPEQQVILIYVTFMDLEIYEFLETHLKNNNLDSMSNGFLDLPQNKSLKLWLNLIICLPVGFSKKTNESENDSEIFKIKCCLKMTLNN